MLSLPDRYWVTQIAGAWYLFNPWDVLIAGPADATTLQRHAWRDLWRRIDQQPNDEIEAIRDGTRSLQELPALRQSFRMSDTVEEVGAERETLPNVARPLRWRPSALVASAIITAFAATAFGVGPRPDKLTSRTIRHEQSLPTSAAVQSHPVSIPRKAVVTNVIRSVGATARLARTFPVHRPPRVAYVVVVGRFESSTAAENMKHLVQSRGYIVHVVPYGAVSEVITTPLRTRRQAENVARGLEAAGLQARLMVWRDQ
jgi:cell division septation protein DedD